MKTTSLPLLLASFLLGITASAHAQPKGVVGPTYFVDITLKNGNTTLGSKKLQWDPGASGTPLSRADAKMLGLLNAQDNPVAALNDPKVKVQTENANGKVEPGVVGSIPLTVSVVGKDKAGKDNGATVTTPDKKVVIYPSKGAADVSSLLGTNIIAELPQEKRTPDGGISYTAPPKPNPAKTVPLKSLNLINLYDQNTGTPVQNPIVGNSLLGIQNATAAGMTLSTTTDLVYDPGSPVMIISQALASELDATPAGTFDLFSTDPGTYANLSFEGFLGSPSASPLSVLILSSLSLPTESGGMLDFFNVPVLVNPVSSVTYNIFGSNVFSNANLNVYDDFAGGLVQLEPVPEPASLVMSGVGLLVLVGWVAGWHAHVFGGQKRGRERMALG